MPFQPIDSLSAEGSFTEARDAGGSHPCRARRDPHEGVGPPSCLCCRDLFDEVRRRLALKGYRWE
jgi:hypothetical protein